MKVGAFQRAITEFGNAKSSVATHWPATISAFDQSFILARRERASYTPYLNILDVFGLKRRELCHSACIAWIFDESSSHERGALFLECFADWIGLRVPNFSRYTVQREKPDRVDVAVFKSRSFAIFIENKVEHVEREHQMSDLVRALVRISDAHAIPIANRFAIFLSDDGRSPETMSQIPPAGFLMSNLRPVKRLTMFERFQSWLDEEAVESELLTALISSYVEAISAHRGSNR